MQIRQVITGYSLAVFCLITAGCTISNTPGTKTPVSVSIQPANPTLPLGLSQNFLAIAQLHDGTSQDVTKQTQWASSNTAVATIDNKGLLKTLSKGTTTVNAVYSSLQASTVVTVTPPGVIAVNISPANPNPIQVGDMLQFAATGTMSDGSPPPNITNKVTWASSNKTAASVSPGGLVTGEAVGVALISATYGSGQNPPTGFVTVIVNPLLMSMSVIPGSINIAPNTNQQFSAIGLYNDGSTQDLTTQASTTWSSACTPSGVVGITSAGLAKASSKTGSCTITASSRTISGTASLTVSSLSLSALSVTPAVPTLPIGVPIQFHATGQFSDGSVQDLTGPSATKWTSGTTSVAGNPSAGKTTTLAQGATAISAQFNSAGPTATTNLTVTAAKLSSIAVTAPLAKLGEGTTVQLKATGTFSDNSTQDLTTAVTWKSSASAISVSASGLATANLPGSATVTASLGSITSAGVTLQVNPETIKSIAIAPTSATIAPTTTQQFKATVTFGDNTQQDITSLVQWNSSDATTATIRDFGTSAGLATGLATGTTNISAVFGSVTASTSTVTVSSTTPSILNITPSNPILTPSKNQATQQMKAVVIFADSTTQDVTNLATWSSSDITRAVVGSNGLVVAAASGGGVTVKITATFGSATNSTTVTIQ